MNKILWENENNRVQATPSYSTFTSETLPENEYLNRICAPFIPVACVFRMHTPTPDMHLAARPTIQVDN